MRNADFMDDTNVTLMYNFQHFLIQTGCQTQTPIKTIAAYMDDNTLDTYLFNRTVLQ